MDIRKFIQESFKNFAPLPGDPPSEESHKSHQQRFDEAIYKTYVQQGYHDQFKPVSKQKFMHALISSHKLEEKRTKEFDKTSIYRLADSKTSWFSNRNELLGEYFEETNEWGDHVESYWLEY
jgi:hypothetical protein